MIEFLDEIKLRIKYNNQIQKYKKSKFLINPIKNALTYEDLRDKVQDALNNGFKCCYCKSKMTQHSTDKPHWRDAYAIDHIDPYCMHGYNSKNNINICCHRCNIIKGTMDLDVFLKVINPILQLDEVNKEYNLNQMFIGAEAREIKRYKEKDKEAGKKQLRLSIFN